MLYNNIVSYFIRNKTDKDSIFQYPKSKNIYIIDKHEKEIYTYNFKYKTSSNYTNNYKKSFINFKISAISIIPKFYKNYIQNIKVFYNENIQREYQINTNFKKKYYMIHNGAPNIYYVNFIYFKGLKYIRKQYNDRNIHCRYTKNFVSLKYYSMFFNIL
jgi:hypothetical protein